MIAAHGENYEIGFENRLLWHISADLKRFKEITSGHTVIMGRLTFNSIGNKSLPNRRNIVLTKSELLDIQGVEYVKSVEEALKIVADEEEVFILGGASIYEQFLSMASVMYLTQVHKSYRADTFFPRYDSSKWEITERIDINDDDQAGVNYSFLTLVRK